MAAARDAVRLKAVDPFAKRRDIDAVKLCGLLQAEHTGSVGFDSVQLLLLCIFFFKLGSVEANFLGSVRCVGGHHAGCLSPTVQGELAGRILTRSHTWP